MIFSTREAIMWEKANPLGLPGKSFQGDNFYTGDNLDPVAMINYYYNENYKSIKDKRRDIEKGLIKSNKDVFYSKIIDEKINKIALCGGRALTHGYYFASILNNYNIYDYSNADYIIISNRNFNLEKLTCDQKFPGKDLLNVKKNNLVLSSFRKLN